MNIFTLTSNVPPERLTLTLKTNLRFKPGFKQTQLAKVPYTKPDLSLLDLSWGLMEIITVEIPFK